MFILKSTYHREINERNSTIAELRLCIESLRATIARHQRAGKAADVLTKRLGDQIKDLIQHTKAQPDAVDHAFKMATINPNIALTLLKILTLPDSEGDKIAMMNSTMRLTAPKAPCPPADAPLKVWAAPKIERDGTTGRFKKRGA